MLCPRCKRENIEGATFCIYCGRRLKEAETARPIRVAALRPLLLVILALIVVAGGLAVGWYLTSRPGEQREAAGPPATLVQTPTGTIAGRATEGAQGATLELPPATGVESQTATITEVTEPSQPATEVTLVSPVFEVTGSSEILAEPARLTLPLLPEVMDQLDDKALLTIAWWNGSQWLPIGGEVDEEGKSISAEVRHLSLFTAIRLELPLLPRDTDHFRIIPVVLPQGYSVDELAGRLEAAWDRVIGRWEYEIPMHIQEGRRIQVWIVPWIPGQREGAVGEYLDKVEERLLPYVNYDIYLEPTLSDVLAEVAPAHEFYHIVQINSYLHPQKREELDSVLWWMEATATWAGAKALGGREAEELGRFHQGTPSLLAQSLDSLQGRQRYAAGAFVCYLEELHGAALIKDTWDRLALKKEPLEAIDGALRAVDSSLEAAYLDFVAQYAYLREPEWLQRTMNLAANTPDPRGLAFRVETAPGSTTIARPHLGGEVVALLTPAESTLKLSFDWGDQGEAWRVRLYVLNGDGGIETSEVAYPKTQYVIPWRTGVTQVVVIAMNTSLVSGDAALGLSFLSVQPDPALAGVGPNQTSPGAAGQAEGEWRIHLPGEWAMSVAADRDGHIWVGTEHNVQEFDGSVWRSWTPGDANYSSIAVDQEGHVWTAELGEYSWGDLWEYDGQQWYRYTEGDRLARLPVATIVVDQDGHRWFGGVGVTEFDGFIWRTYTMNDGLADKLVYSSAVDASGTMWFGTALGGLSRFDRHTWTTYTTANGLPSNSIEAVTVDAAGHVWVGTTHNGVGLFDGTAWRTYTQDDGLASDLVRAIAIDHKEQVWVGGSGGVAVFDGQSWKTYTSEDGLAGNWVSAIAVDKAGRIWLATTEGISEYVPGESAESLTEKPAGTTIPLQRETITAANAEQVVELASWGKGIISQIAYSPDGRFLAVASTIGIYLYDAESLEDVRFIESGKQLSSVTFSRDGTVVASGCHDGTVRLWRVSDEAMVRTLEAFSDEVVGLEFSPDGSALVGYSDYGTAGLWRIADGALLRILERDADPGIFLAFSPDSTLLASANDDGTVGLWRVADGALVRMLGDNTGGVDSVAFSPDSALVAAGYEDGTVRLWQVADGALLRTLVGNGPWVWRVAFSPDGTTIATGDGYRVVRLWRVGDGALLRTFEGLLFPSLWDTPFLENGAVLALRGEVSPEVWAWQLWQVTDGKLLRSLETWVVARPEEDEVGFASVPNDATVRLWPEYGAPLRSLEGYTGWGPGMAFSPNGQLLALLALGYDDRITQVQLWRVADGSLVRALEGNYVSAGEVAFSPSGELLASTHDGNIWLWQVVDGTLLRILEGHTDDVESVAFAPDGATLASGSRDGTVRLWRAADRVLLRTLEGHTSGVLSVAFAPDGATLASGSGDATVRLWRAADGVLLRTLEGHTSGVLSVAFAPDGTTLASGSGDGTVRLWRAADGELLRTLAGHTAGVLSVAFAPDGATLASGFWDGTVRLWRTADGALLRTLEGHTDEVERVAFSPDGATLASGSADGTVRLWGCPAHE